MSNPTSESRPDSIERLLELYKILDEQVSRLESYIWQTATLLGIGSAVGLFSLANGVAGIKLNEATIAALFAINASLIWWRFAKRWWSIQHLKFERMDEIEKRLVEQMKLGQGSTVRERDVEAMQHIKYQREKGGFRQRIASLQFSIPRDIKARESQRTSNYEHRGNQPVGKLLVVTNIALWLMFATQTAILAVQTDIGIRMASLMIAGVVFVLFVDLSAWRKQ